LLNVIVYEQTDRQTLLSQMHAHPRTYNDLFTLSCLVRVGGVNKPNALCMSDAVQRLRCNCRIVGQKT